MKKSLLTKSILAAGIFGAVSANAAMGDMKFYAGAGLDYNMYSYGDAKNGYDKVKGNGMGFLVPTVGVKFHDNFGVEAGYSFNKKIKGIKSGSNDETLKVKNMYLDLVGFMPAADQIELIGGLGIGRLTAKKGDNIAAKFEIKNKFSWRAKIGAQYNFNTNVAARLTATYQQVGNKIKDTAANTEQKLIKNIKTIGLGVFYTF